MIYVCSDIHGDFNKYRQIFHKLKDSDKVYVLGDCIDRNPHGVKILSDIMEQPNIELLLGNHEDMMYRAVFCDNAEEKHHWAPIWCHPINGGRETLKDLDKAIVDSESFNKYKIFLENCLVKKEIEVGGRRFCLSHACNFMPDTPEVRYKEASLADLEDWLWHGPLSSYVRCGCLVKSRGCYEDNNITHINGHTPVQLLRGFDSKEQGYFQKSNVIGIDGGIATGSGYLILLRLDDMKQYIIK